MSAFILLKGTELIKRTLEMSNKEIDRVGVVKLVESKKLSQIEGAKQLSISTRQMRRLQQNHRQDSSKCSWS